MLIRPFWAALAALLALLALGLGGEYAVGLEKARLEQEQRSRAVGAIGQYRARLEAELNATIYLTNGLVAYVATQAKLQPEVAQAMLKVLYEQGRHIRNIGLAPGNRLSYIYPLQGNEKAIGLYYPDLPEQWPAVERAIRERRPTLAGPVRLKQGGNGLIYRMPVFTGPQGTYWGLLSMVIDPDRLFAQVGIAPEADGFRIALRGKDAGGATGEAFLGDTALFASDAVTATIGMPGGSWQIALRPLDGWISGDRLAWLRAGVWGAAVLLGLLFYAAFASIAKRLRAESELRASEAQLRENAEKLRGLYELAPLGIALTDMNGHYLEFNEAFRQICGYAADELNALDYWALTPPEYREHEVQQLETLCRTGRYGPYEKEYVQKSGRRVPLRLNGMLVQGKDGGQYIWSIVEDISASRRVADELLAAKRAAEAGNQAKSRFLATVSHELRTPMNGILGMAQLLLQSGLSEEDRLFYARTILNSGETLLTLLNDILDLAKVDAGKLRLESSVFAAAQLLQEAQALFGQLAQQKGLALLVQWRGPEDQRYLGDSYRLRQMLSNLVSNAIKFSEQGSIRVEGRELSRDGGAAVLEFSVADNGIGIPEEKQALLFQPFSQLDGSTTRRFGGSGLGLSIVRNLAELMDGEVGVASEAGQGARFWFRVRVGLAAAQADGRRSARPLENPALAVESPVPALSGRVLVVEDNALNRMVVSTMLGKLGLSCVMAENGRQGLEAATSGEPVDLVLMDVEMPVMDGLAATRGIRAWEKENGRDHLPIVALTAGAFEENRRRCLEAGMDDFLAKPLSLTKLRAVLEQQLGRQA
jgi:PAS domain S-box-containing protein